MAIVLRVSPCICNTSEAPISARMAARSGPRTTRYGRPSSKFAGADVPVISVTSSPWPDNHPASVSMNRSIPPTTGANRRAARSMRKDGLQPDREAAAGPMTRMDQLMWIPEIARETMSRWISEVPSKIV